MIYSFRMKHLPFEVLADYFLTHEQMVLKLVEMWPGPAVLYSEVPEAEEQAMLKNVVAVIKTAVKEGGLAEDIQSLIPRLERVAELCTRHGRDESFEYKDGMLTYNFFYGDRLDYRESDGAFAFYSHEERQSTTALMYFMKQLAAHKLFRPK